MGVCVGDTRQAGAGRNCRQYVSPCAARLLKAPMLQSHSVLFLERNTPMLATLFAFRRALLTSVSLLLAGGASSLYAPTAHAQFLVGAELFAATSTGATSSNAYENDTNSTSGITPLNITFNGSTNGQAISFGLLNGSNTLTFNQNSGVPFSSYGGSNGDLGLFFSSTSTSYNPSSGARQPDLLVSRASNGSTAFFFPANGTTINDYVFPNTTTYGGATSFLLGATPVTVTSYSVNDGGTGSFVVRVGAAGPAATPEPGTLAILVSFGMTGAGFVARRKRRK